MHKQKHLQDIPTMNHIGSFFWHITDFESLLKILEDGNLSIDKSKEVTYKLVLPADDSYTGMGEPGATEQYFKEPKMVCFTDIPLNILPLHARAYGEAALGISQNDLRAKYPVGLRPVQYFTLGMLNESYEDLKEKGLIADDNSAKGLAKWFKFEGSVKQKDGTERYFSFEEIYSEREWRSIDTISLSSLDVTLIVRKSQLSELNQLEGVTKQHKINLRVFGWEELYGTDTISDERS